MSRIQIHGFGGFKEPGQEAFDAPVLSGEASQQARLEHLMVCIKVKDREIATLRTRLETLRLKQDLEHNDFMNQINALAAAQDTLSMIERDRRQDRIISVRGPKRNKSWKFWKRDNGGNYRN